MCVYIEMSNRRSSWRPGGARTYSRTWRGRLSASYGTERIESSREQLLFDANIKVDEDAGERAVCTRGNNIVTV